MTESLKAQQARVRRRSYKLAKGNAAQLNYASAACLEKSHACIHTTITNLQSLVVLEKLDHGL